MKRLMIFLLFPLLLIAWDSKAEGLFVYYDKQTDLFGFKDANGSLVIPPQFDHIAVPQDSEPLFIHTSGEYEFLVPVHKHGKLWRMTKDGSLKFEAVFFDNGADYYEEGLARFLKDGKVGFHDLKGNIVIEPAYDFASPFRDGYSHVCNGCYAQYPKNPTYPPLRSSAYPRHREDMYLEIISGKWGAIDKEGNIVIPLIYNSVKEMIIQLRKQKKLENG